MKSGAIRRVKCTCPFPRNLSFCDWHKHARWLYGISSRFGFLLPPPRIIRNSQLPFLFYFFPFCCEGAPMALGGSALRPETLAAPRPPVGAPGPWQEPWTPAFAVPPLGDSAAPAQPARCCPSLALCSFFLLASPSHSCFFSSPFSPPSNLNARKVTNSGQGVRLPARPFWRRLPAVTAVPVRLFGFKPR